MAKLGWIKWQMGSHCALMCITWEKQWLKKMTESYAKEGSYWCISQSCISPCKFSQSLVQVLKINIKNKNIHQRASGDYDVWAEWETWYRTGRSMKWGSYPACLQMPLRGLEKCVSNDRYSINIDWIKLMDLVAGGLRNEDQLTLYHSIKAASTEDLKIRSKEVGKANEE